VARELVRRKITKRIDALIDAQIANELDPIPWTV